VYAIPFKRLLVPPVILRAGAPVGTLFCLPACTSLYLFRGTSSCLFHIMTSSGSASQGAAPTRLFPEGSLVEVHGLRSEPSLNGLSGIILGLAPAAAAASDSGQVARYHVQISSNGKQISCKATNLRHARDTFFHHALLGGSLLEAVRSNPRLRDHTRCDTFVQTLWEYMCEIPPALALHDAHIPGWRREFLTAPGHKLYWLGLEAITQHVLLEKRDQRWRAFQSYIYSTPDDRPDAPAWHPGRGFSAGEWCNAATAVNRMDLNPAHRRYGGGRSLSNEEIEPLFAAIDDLQAVTKELLEGHLLGQVPYPAKMTRTTQDMGVESVVAGFSRDMLQFASRWASLKLEQIALQGITLDGMFPSGQLIPGRPLVVRLGPAEVLLRVPHALAERARRIKEFICGERMDGLMFMRMVNQCAGFPHLRSATGDGMGFVVYGADIDKALGPKQGAATNAQRWKEARNDYKKAVWQLPCSYCGKEGGV